LRNELELLDSKQSLGHDNNVQQQNDSASLAGPSLADLMESEQRESDGDRRLREAEERWNEERKQLLELVKPFRSNLADLQNKNAALNQARREKERENIAHFFFRKALEEVARLKALLDEKSGPSQQEQEDELRAARLMGEEARRRLAEALLERNSLAATLRRLGEQREELLQDSERRASVGGGLGDKSLPKSKGPVPRLGEEGRAVSVAQLGPWRPAPAAAASDERKIVDRLVALERKMKVLFFFFFFVCVFFVLF
jgi:hypothetical protein